MGAAARRCFHDHRPHDGNGHDGHLGRRAVLLALGALALLGAVVGLPAPRAHARPLVQRYGADPAQVRAAVDAAGWPQAGRTWCGLAAMTAAIDFASPTPYSQQSVAHFLESDAARSAWGMPAPNSAIAYGPGFSSDISRDVGTDPRAMAYGESALTGQSYHQVVDRGDAQDATAHLIADVVRSRQPIDVIVFNGGHSVLVSAVLATADPIAHPESVTALEVWDPGYGIPQGNIQLAQMVDVPLSDWYSNDYYWASPYEANYHGAVAEDPDPAVGPYTYDPSRGLNGHLWDTHYVYIRPDAPTDNANNVSADWAFNQNDALIRGAHGERPPGYAGPLVSMTSDAPIPNPAAATPTPRPTPTATARPHATPTPVRGKAAPPNESSINPVVWLAPGLLLLLLGGSVVLAALRSGRRAQWANEMALDRTPQPVYDGHPGVTAKRAARREDRAGPQDEKQ